MSVEHTDLERRVLAHEHILRALIRHMAEAEPDFLARLKRTFGRGHTLGQDDHDFTSTQRYEEKFIEEIEKAVHSGHDPR